MKIYSDSLSRCARMALLIVVMLVPPLAIDPLGLNAPAGVTTPVSAQGGTGWSGTWKTIGPMWTEANLTLTQSGNQVTGYLVDDPRSTSNIRYATLVGTVSGNKCSSVWTFITKESADIELTLSPDGQSITGRSGGTVTTWTWAGISSGSWVLTLAPDNPTVSNQASAIFTRIAAGTTKGTGAGTDTTSGTGTTTGTGAGGKGDYNGDGKVTELDALAALKMSVGSLQVNLNLDMDGNGKVKADDALAILKKAVGK